MKMLGWEKMIRRIVRVWIQLFFYLAHRSSTSNSTSSSSDSYTSTHFIAMREPQRRFQAFFVGKANYFFTRTIFFVDSLAPYVHFHKENGFPFTRKPWVGTGFLGVSNSSTYSRPYFSSLRSQKWLGRGPFSSLQRLSSSPSFKIDGKIYFREI